MSDVTDLEAARLELELRADVHRTPELDSDEIDAILARSQAASTWALSTAYSIGDVVLPNPRDGHRYVCVAAGTSGSTQPTFGTGNESRTADGAVTWQESGLQSGIYDMRRAIYAALELRAMKAASMNQYVNDGRAAGDSYLYLNLVRERDRYALVAVV